LTGRTSGKAESKPPNKQSALKKACAPGAIAAYSQHRSERAAMAEERNEDEERPCLHCMMVEMIDDFFAEYPVSTDEPDAIDTDEVITAVAKTVAELTYSLDDAGRQKMIEQLMREIMSYDAEYRQQDELGAAGSGARH
jgi:hypothetical protein